MTRASDLARLLGAGATINDGTTITTADNTAQLELVSTDADSGIGPHQVFYRNSSSPADADLLCELDFRGRNDNSQDVNYATVNVKANDVTDGEEDGEYILQVMTAGSVDTTMHIKPTEIVFNEDQIDRDFRVESDSNTHAFFVEGSTGDVGIGPSTINKTLHISKSTTSTDGTVYPGLQIENTSAGSGNSYANFVLHGGNATTQFSILADGRSSNSDVYIRTDTATPLLFLTNGSERMRIHSGGQITAGNTSYGAHHFVYEANTGGNAVMKVRNSAGSGSGQTALLLSLSERTTANDVFLQGNNGYNNYYLLANGTHTFTSDENRKKNIETTRDGYLEDLAKLRVVKYNWKNDEDGADKELGLIAQEVEKVFPKLVMEDPQDASDTDETKFKMIKISVLPMMLLKALQEANTKITALEAKINFQETNINDLQKKSNCVGGFIVLGHAAIAEAAIADVGGNLLAASAELNGVASKTSVGVGILAGIADLSGDFTQTSTGLLIGITSADISADFTQTTAANRLDVTEIDISADFTQTADGILIAITSATADLNFTKTSSGDIMFVDVVTDATTETYTEITPSGTETWTEITPSGTETYTEIVR